jgi:predicted NAD/FAD-binding protein
LRDWLHAEGYGRGLVEDHLLPMAAAIWSTPASAAGDQPAASFIGFCQNHGLLQVRNRPVWRTISGGSRCYVERLTAPYLRDVRLNCGALRIERGPESVLVIDSARRRSRFDHVVIATHPDQALRMIADPSGEEARRLAAIRYGSNVAVLHTDAALMPRRRAVWSSWNYLGCGAPDGPPAVTYWMNRLQRLACPQQLFVTLNPPRPPDPALVLHTETYTHPHFDCAAMSAQRRLWSLQGVRRTWFCGAWFGAGFHEDGLQAGLAVAEQLGGMRRPWQVADPSGRIHLAPIEGPPLALVA